VAEAAAGAPIIRPEHRETNVHDGGGHNNIALSLGLLERARKGGGDAIVLPARMELRLGRVKVGAAVEEGMVWRRTNEPEMAPREYRIAATMI